MNKGTDLSEQNGFLTLQNFDIIETIQEEMAGLELTFDKIKIPSGGSINFELPSDDSDSPEAVKEFSGVIVYHHPVRMYYKDKYTGSNNPPDCGSFDAVTGVGNPGGNCSKCSFNQFGTAPDGIGKACKDRRRIFVLREGEIFPMLLSLPTGSLKNFMSYIKRLLSKQKKTTSVVTKFTLKKAVNAKGIVYSQGVFSIDRDLTADEQKLILKMSEQIKLLAMNIGFDEDNAHEGESIMSTVIGETKEIIESAN